MHQDARNLEICVMLLVLYKLFLGTATRILSLRFVNHCVPLGVYSVYVFY